MLKWKRLLLALAESEARRTRNTVKNFVFLCRVSASEKRRVVRVHVPVCVCVGGGGGKRNRPLHAPPVLQGSPSISIRFMLSFAMPHWPLALWLLNQLAHHGGGHTGVIRTHSHMFARTHTPTGTRTPAPTSLSRGDAEPSQTVHKTLRLARNIPPREN